MEKVSICPGSPRSKAAKLWRRIHWPKCQSKCERARILNDLPSDLNGRLREIRRRKSE